MAIQFADYPVIDPSRLYDDCLNSTPPIPVDGWRDKANLFDVARGEEPGRGAVLMAQEDMEAINDTTSHYLRFQDDQTGQAILLSKISIVRATCVVPGAAREGTNVYLVELADRRIELQRIPISKAFNLVKPDGTGYHTATINPSGSVAWTWQTMFANIWTLLGIGSTPTLPFTPNGTPENFDFYGGYAWAALNAVLARIACTVVYDPVADTFTLFRLGTATATDGTTAVDGTTGDEVLTCWDEYPTRTARGTRPEKIRVLFRRYPAPTDGTDAFYSKTITLTAATGVISGSILQLQDDMGARGTGTPSNDADLQTRAQERADDWLRKYLSCDPSFMRQYRGWRYRLTKAVGPKYLSVGYEDRGAGFRSQVLASPTYSLELFKSRLPEMAEPPPAYEQVHVRVISRQAATGISPSFRHSYTVRPVYWNPWTASTAFYNPWIDIDNTGASDIAGVYEANDYEIDINKDSIQNLAAGIYPLHQSTTDTGNADPGGGYYIIEEQFAGTYIQINPTTPFASTGLIKYYEGQVNANFQMIEGRKVFFGGVSIDGTRCRNYDIFPSVLTFGPGSHYTGSPTVNSNDYDFVSNYISIPVLANGSQPTQGEVVLNATANFRKSLTVGTGDNAGGWSQAVPISLLQTADGDAGLRAVFNFFGFINSDFIFRYVGGYAGTWYTPTSSLGAINYVYSLTGFAFGDIINAGNPLLFKVGITDSKSWTAVGGAVHTVTISGGIITEWTVV